MSDTEITVVPDRQDIVLSRVFEAPRDIVFRACTDPALVPRWWGPGHYNTTVERDDVTAGGIWRYTSRDENGVEYRFHGVYHEITPPHRIVATFEFEGMPGHVSLETVTLWENGADRTRYVGTSVFQSVADRDGMVQAGMEEGAREGMTRLAEVIRVLRERSGQ
ncbi:Uncharacterized conserved protein YndB, AHSA1/START domain [Actinopolyspora xinjiangensis]|uniref:Uncharacterized conserved protein YndB, AHSA1/START domain n=1 Tax=Actinopolyspora xinjiangensis TaxID=405564 RepID=A0A1H0RSW4_9ACTN|nr:SRPBCC family protein [Actinopolyspora xinjiangensis]SDP32078.1 Uncharacterized conserved protein YndB, AHSA1/START domain [Actinopolyspora xinjiangensis]